MVQITELRRKILERLGNDPDGFKQDLQPLEARYPHGEARHPGYTPDLTEGGSWDSYIYVTDDNNVLIILQYLSGAHNGWQRIALRGDDGIDYEFALRLCIYDLAAPPREVRHRVLFGNLLRGLENIPRGIECPGNEWLGNEQVGHVVDFPIRSGQNALWTPGNEGDLNAFLDAVTTGVTEVLLPLARRYVDNRGALFVPPPPRYLQGR